MNAAALPGFFTAGRVSGKKCSHCDMDVDSDAVAFTTTDGKTFCSMACMDEHALGGDSRVRDNG